MCSFSNTPGVKLKHFNKLSIFFLFSLIFFLLTFVFIFNICHFIFRLRLLSPQTQRLFNQVTGEAVRRSRSLERGYHEVCGDIICPSIIQGIDHIRDPRLNKGLAFTLEERQVLGIHGLQPARFKTQEEQLELCLISIRRYKESLNKYLYLVDLQVSKIISFINLYFLEKMNIQLHFIITTPYYIIITLNTFTLNKQFFITSSKIIVNACTIEYH